MSSVGGSDSKRASENEAVRRKYEDYRQKESEMVKKHQREIRRLNEQHYAEMERVKQEHQAQMAEMNKGSRDAISRRDHKYQQDMEDVRNVHRNQLQKVAEDNQKREDILRKTTSSDTAQERRSNADRLDTLTRDYEANLRRQQEQYTQAREDGRAEQQRAIEGNRERLTKAHEKETNVIRADRESSVRNLQKEFDEYRRTTSRAKDEHEVADVQKQKRASDALMAAVRAERNSRVDGEQEMRQGFGDALGKMRKRYEKTMQDRTAAYGTDQENLKSGMVKRIDDQVHRLEVENAELEKGNARREMKLKNQTQREIANAREAFQENVENYKNQRDEAVRTANESNRKDIREVRGELENQLVETNRFYRGRMDEQNRIMRTAYDNLKGDFEARNEQGKTQADERVKQIVEITENEKLRLIDMNQENHTASQRLKADQMKALRETMEGDKQAAVNRLQDQMRKQELQHAERMNLVVSKYEKQVQSLKDQLVRERKLSDENTRRLTDELARVHKMEVDQVEAKNREKVRQMNTQHSEELRLVNKRHEERLDQVLTEVKKV